MTEPCVWFIILQRYRLIKQVDIYIVYQKTNSHKRTNKINVPSGDINMHWVCC